MSCTSAPSSNGFARNPKAPASSAVWRTNGSSRPVMKMIRVAGEFSRRQACTSKQFMTGIHTSETTTRQIACSSLERKATGWLNLSTLKPAAFTKRPSAFSIEASSSRSQMELQPSTCKGETCAPDSWRCFNEKSKSGIYVFDELQLDLEIA